MPPVPTTVLYYHRAGPVTFQATVGAFSSGVYATGFVGVCEDGIDLEFKTFVREIKTDGAGGPDGAPADVYLLNTIVNIRCVLVPFVGTYINRLRAAAQGNIGGTDGVMAMPGTLFRPTLSLIAAGFSSGDPDGGFTFPTCRVVKCGDMKASPQVTKLSLELQAIAAYDPATLATIQGTTLYARV